MITNVGQRWRDRRDSFRQRGEAFSPAAFEVAAIPGDNVAKAFVERHHYSGSFPAARERFGLYCGGELVGVAVYSVPCHPAVISNWFPFEWRAGVELGRFVLLDAVPFNAESWFLARTRELLKAKGYLGIVSFADPVARPRAGGGVRFAGHVGTIYQASNAILAGRGRGQSMLLLPNGTAWHRRNLGKVIGLKHGWPGAVETLEHHGAAKFDAGLGEAGRRTWLGAALAKTTTPLKHPGCLRYLWGLTKGVRKHLPSSDPYPKIGGQIRAAA